MWTRTSYVQVSPDTRTLKEFTIYDTSEALNKGISFKPWWECTIPGEWGETDDGYVTELISFATGTNRLKHVTEFRRFSARFNIWDRSCRRPYFAAFKSNQPKPTRGVRGVRRAKIRKVSRKTPKTIEGVVSAATPAWLKKDLFSTRLRSAVHIAALYKIAGKPIDYAQVGKTYRPTDQIPVAKGKQIFRYKEVRQMMDKDIAETLKINEIDPKYVLDSLKRIATKAEEAEDYGNARLIYQDFLKLLDMYPKPVTQKLLPESSDGADAQFTEITEGDMPPKPQIPETIQTKFEELQ